MNQLDYFSFLYLRTSAAHYIYIPSNLEAQGTHEHFQFVPKTVQLSIRRVGRDRHVDSASLFSVEQVEGLAKFGYDGIILDVAREDILGQEFTYRFHVHPVNVRAASRQQRPSSCRSLLNAQLPVVRNAMPRRAH